MKIKDLHIYILLLLIFGSCRSKKDVILSSRSQLNIKHFVDIDDKALDHSSSIQKAINHCHSNQIDTLFFPKGTYNVRKVDTYPGLVYLGEEGTVMKKIPLAGKWPRMFTTQKNPYKGVEDSKPIVFENIDFDGNKENQGPYKKYQLQQQHILYFNGDPSMPGRVKGIVKQCKFYNSVADAVSVWKNADVEVYGCEAYNVFRGGVVATGGNSKVYVKNFKAGGKDDVTGIDIEIDSPGYGGKKDVDVTLINVSLEGDFDVNMPEGGKLYADNVTVTGSGFFMRASDGSKAVIKNSTFYFSSKERTRIYFPGDVLFDNCTFNIHPTDKASGLDVFMETGYRRKGNQKLAFNECDFIVRKGGSGKAFGIYNQENFTHVETNQLIVTNCVFDGNFESAIRFRKGGNVVLDNVYFKQGNAISSNSVRGRMPTVLKANNIRIGENATSFFTLMNSSDKDKIEINRVIVDDSTTPLLMQDEVNIKEVINSKELSNARSSKAEIFDKRGLIIKDNE